MKDSYPGRFDPNQIKCGLPPDPPQKVRLAILIGSLKTGGTELQTIQLVEKIDKTILDVTVITLGEEGPLGSKLRQKQTEVIALNIKKKKIVADLFQLYSILRKQRFDVLYCVLDVAIIVGGVVGKLAGVRLIVGGLRGLGKTWRSHVIWGLRLVQVFVDKFIVNSQAVKNAHACREWIRPNRIEIIPNGIDQEQFAYCSEKDNIIGIVGSLKQIKGQTQFIEAANYLIRNGLDYTFVIVGDGPDRKKLEDLVHRRCIQDRVVFTGNIDNVFEYVKKFKILVSASASEGLSNAIIEAMSTGTPVIASNVASNNEVVTPMIDGLLYDYGNHEHLACQIRFLLDQPELYRALQFNCRKKVEAEYSMHSMVKRTEKLFLSVGSKLKRD